MSHGHQRQGFYDAYMRSMEWQMVKQRWRNDPLRPHACERCGDTPYDLHHRTYARLGRERLSDLEALCRACHQVEHEG